MTSLKRRLIRFIRKPFVKLWRYSWSKTDTSFKKMCLIASLHATVNGCKDNDIVELKKLNAHMGLVKDINAMRLPVLLGPLLWRRALPLDKMDMNKKNAVTRIIRKLPCWIKYSDNETMRSDIMELFGYYDEQKFA